MRTLTRKRQFQLHRTLPLVIALLLSASCATGPATETAPILLAPFRPPSPLGLDAFAPVPEENLLTREKAELGRLLFFDPLLSRDRSLSCAFCHRPELAFADSVPLSPGIQGRPATRNVPTLLNRAYGRSFFWDGRAETLEEAVLMPIVNPDELGLRLSELVVRLRNDRTYRALFRQAFGGEPISDILIGRALASYLRTLRSGDAPVDRYVAGDTGTLTATARRGRSLFLGKAGCADCHSGPNFTDERFHNTGVSWGSADLGRFSNTGEEADRGRFKTPTLREVSRTAPYMHDGSLSTLEEVIEFYDRGGGSNRNPGAEIRPLHLSPDEKADLTAFLRALARVPGPEGR